MDAIDTISTMDTMDAIDAIDTISTIVTIPCVATKKRPESDTRSASMRQTFLKSRMSDYE